METKKRNFKVERKTFFCAERESDVHLMVMYVDGLPSCGKVYCDDKMLILSDADSAREYFYNMAAKQEADYAVMRARVRALTGFKP